MKVLCKRDWHKKKRACYGVYDCWNCGSTLEVTSEDFDFYEKHTGSDQGFLVATCPVCKEEFETIQVDWKNV